MLVFPTTLNPGLPIFLGGALSIAVSSQLALAGWGKYYRQAAVLPIILLCWMAFCGFFTLDDYLSWRYITTFVGGAAMALMSVVGIKNRRQWRFSAHLLLTFCAVSSLLAWPAALMVIKSTGSLPALLGNFNNPDTFSVLPLVGIFLALGLVHEAGPKETVVHLVVASLLLLTMVATGCRAALLGFALGALFFVVSISRLKRELAKTKMLIAAPLVVVVLLVPVLGFSFSVSHKFQRFISTAGTDSESLRMELLWNGWKAVAENPLTGAGPGAFGLAYQSVRPPNHDFHFIDIAHNDFLEFASESGIVGLILWSMLTWFAFKTPFRLRHGKRPTEAIAVCSAVLALAAFSQFNFIVVQRPSQWVQLWLFGLCLAFPSSRYREESSRQLELTTAALMAGFGLWAGVTGARHVVADSYYQMAFQAEQKLELAESERWYGKAEGLCRPFVRMTLRRIRLLEKIRLFDDVDNLNKQEQILEYNLHSSPHDTRLLLALARVKLKQDDAAAALALLKQAHDLAPYERKVFDARLQTWLALGELEAAASALMDWTPNHREEADRFSRVLLALYVVSPEKGDKILAGWLKQNPEEFGVKVAETTLGIATQSRDLVLQKRILTVLSQEVRDSYCYNDKLAQLLERSEGDKAQFEYLDGVLSNSKPDRDRCYQAILSVWAMRAAQFGQLQRAQTKLAKYLEFNKNAPEPRVTLAKILLSTGRGDEAAGLLRDGLALTPDNLELNLQMARHYEQVKMHVLASDYYRTVLRLEPSNPEAAKKLKELRKKF